MFKLGFASTSLAISSLISKAPASLGGETCARRVSQATTTCPLLLPHLLAGLCFWFFLLPLWSVLNVGYKILAILLKPTMRHGKRGREQERGVKVAPLVPITLLGQNILKLLWGRQTSSGRGSLDSWILQLLEQTVRQPKTLHTNFNSGYNVVQVSS